MRGFRAILAFAIVYFVNGHLHETDDHWWAHKYSRRVRDLGKADAEDLRLPKNLSPISYRLELIPLLEEGKFTTDGTVTIRVECLETSNYITLNAADIQIVPLSTTVTSVDDNAPLNVSPNILDEQDTREMITISTAPTTMTKGKLYDIRIRFVSILNDQLRGLYRSSYVENGDTKYLAVSQFEAPDARRAFPCFDEPNMKATFTISVGHRGDKTPISNMPREGLSLPIGVEYPGYFRTNFQTSVKMPTYLVAMMVSEFEGVESDPSLSNTAFRVWARPSFRDQTKYAGTIGPKVLEYFEYFYQIDYPLPKQDMAALPDFAAGAMENWGLITYREADLLFDEHRSSEAAKQRIAEIVAHELAHQWFGNLVTMDWWNVIWLNEGFARYMQYVGAHAVEPSFRMLEQFGVVTMQAVFQVDSLESSRPINMEANTAAEINAMFDTISYNKGGSIIRMCAHFLGLETFRYGIIRYLRNNAYGNTVQDDLWEALQQQAVANAVGLPVTVKEIMDSWTDRMGFPLINVTRYYDRGSGAYISQDRFLLRKSSSGSTDSTVYRWWVPLTFTSNFDEEAKTAWLSPTQDTLTITDLEASRDEWVIFNVDQVGYYRVHYDDQNYRLILEQLAKDHKEISAVNRAQLIDDSLNIARAGLMTYSRAMETTSYLISERDYIPWLAASNALDYIDLMFHSQTDETEWKTYMASLIDKLYQYVGFNQGARDSHLHIYLRSLAVTWACTRLDHAGCIQSAKSVYSSWMSNPNGANNNGISPNLLRLVTCTAIANGGQAEWNHAYQKYLASTLINEKVDLLRALTCSKDVAIINQMLEMMITSNSGIRLQDVNTVFTGIANNEVGHSEAISFMTSRWDDIIAYLDGFEGFGGGAPQLLFRALCNRINTPQKLTRLLFLKSSHDDVLGSSKSVQQGVELAQANVQWVSDYYRGIVEWLKIRNNPISSTTVTSPPSTVGCTTASTAASTTARTGAATTQVTSSRTTYRPTNFSATVHQNNAIKLIVAFFVTILKFFSM